MLINACDMTPGKTYKGTLDGPEEMVDLAFTVLATVSFNPESHNTVPNDKLDPGTVMQVQYDAWAFPFPQSQTFSPFDLVTEVES